MSQPETHSFQAEIQQLLNIVIHSLYTDKEIFVRELVSNAADALEKLRFLQASGKPVLDPDLALKISITTDETAKTVTFIDTGIGMTREEIVANLGTIARSGSKEFVRQLAEAKEKTVDLIGQFGVGFYASFMVASRVTVWSRSQDPEAKGVRWSSEGAGSYEIEEADDVPRGTKIVLQLKEDQDSFAQGSQIERILRHYSSFVPVPIELNGTPVNTVQAIWTRSKSDIKEEEYEEFYKYIGHDHEKPRYRLHFKADAPLSINALLFIPQRSMEKMGLMKQESEVNLYCRKVMIQANAKGLFPEWLRFLKGVVDSEDLPLNISRETMQDSSLLQKLNKVLTGRILKTLDDESKSDPAAYDSFFDEFGLFLKEGVLQDYTHREALAPLLRYGSSALEKEKTTSLTDYVSRMKPDQTEIFYLLAPNRDAAEASPYYEAFQSKGLEVLFLTDPRDEFVMDHLREFQGKKLKSAEKAEIQTDGGEGGLSEDDGKALATWVKEALAGRVKDVRMSKRLTGSPAVVIEDDPFMTGTMKKLMRSARPESAMDSSTPVLELNPRHEIVKRLQAIRGEQEDLAKKVSEQLLDNALIAAGLLEDPRVMLKRMNELLERLVK